MSANVVSDLLRVTYNRHMEKKVVFYLFSYRFLKTAFDGEVMAIYVALKQIAARSYNRMVILSDSKAAIQAIRSREIPISRTIQDCQVLLESLRIAGRQITLQWIPRHCDIYGNELAGMLAKKGTQIIQQPSTLKSFHSARLYIKHFMRQNWKALLTSRISSRSWRNSLEQGIADKPRIKAVAEFRFVLGHDCLANHLCRIGILADPNCPLCSNNELMDRNHLLRCSALRGDSEVRRYWSARHLLMR
ncbi:uncharacterized protein [Parasteatoda tepidariorum]|uniref:uncharacterized protein n=1 Tax=Parasteatoda tepidariorum TaxID=114398 RepID=UPI00077F93F6|nr:uncharacterized protein LOC107445742 [Parasteatoda tepidariorum]